MRLRGDTSGDYLAHSSPCKFHSMAENQANASKRPIEWLLYSPGSSTAVIITPEEAEVLIPEMRAMASSSSAAITHLIAYSPPTTKNMEAFNTLGYYSLPSLPDGHVPPSWLTIELGIFAGRLYFGFHELGDLKAYFRQSKSEPSDATAGFTQEPESFMIEWLALRRNGQDIMHTPMGYLCQGRSLHAKHPFFVKRHDVEDVGSSETGTSGEGAVDDATSDSDESDWSHVEDMPENFFAPPNEEDGGDGSDEEIFTAIRRCAADSDFGLD